MQGQQQLQQLQDFRSICVDGNIGAGKTTVITRLKERLNRRGGRAVSCTEEEANWKCVNGINLLELLYKNAKVYANCFQYYMLYIRTQQFGLLQTAAGAVRDKDHPGNNFAKLSVQIAERSVATTHEVFGRALLHPLDFAIQTRWLATMRRQGLEPLYEIRIYLRTNSACCYRRVQQRGRHEEEGLDAVYLDSLERLYDQYYQSQPNSSYYVIDGTQCLENIVDQIMDILGGPTAGPKADSCCSSANSNSSNE